MVLTPKQLIGSILGFFGGFLFLWPSYYAFRARTEWTIFISDYGVTWNEVNFNPEFFTIRFIITILWGILTITGALLTILGKRFGNIFCFIGGIGGIVGFFMIIGYIEIPQTYGGIPVSLSATNNFIEDVFAIVAGLVLTEPRGRNP